VQQPGFHAGLETSTSQLLTGLRELASRAGIPFTTNQVGSMFGLFFTELDSVRCFADVNTCNMEQFKAFFHAMLDAGVYLAPSAFEAGFISSAHDADAIAATLTAAEKAFMTLKG
jgi:glutamate-1-semialdehyde 2,1-aminomutase